MRQRFPGDAQQPIARRCNAGCALPLRMCLVLDLGSLALLVSLQIFGFGAQSSEHPMQLLGRHRKSDGVARGARIAPTQILQESKLVAELDPQSLRSLKVFCLKCHPEVIETTDVTEYLIIEGVTLLGRDLGQNGHLDDPNSASQASTARRDFLCSWVAVAG
jgi:hypothetical protein